MKVLLISANMLITPYSVYPLGLDYVAGAIDNRHQVEIADMNCLKSLEALGAKIRESMPDLIGVSLRNIDNTDACNPGGFTKDYQDLVNTIRKVSTAILVLGGSGFTIFPRELMEALGADYGIIGEGERLNDLLDVIERGGDGSKVPGVVTRQCTEKPLLPLGNDFSRTLHAPGRISEFYLKNGGMLNLQSKRGCCFQCIYCTYPHIEGRSLRLIPPEEVADTAIKLQQAGAKYLFITDSAFNSHIRHSMAVAKAFKKSGLSIPWGGFFAPVRLPEDYFRIMADSGLTHVEFGTESLCDSVLAAYGKPFSSGDVLKTHMAAVQAGVNVAHFFLLGGPGETRETLDHTLSNIENLKKTVLFFFCGMRIYPHTDLYETALGLGQVSKATNLLEPVFFKPDSLENHEILDRIVRASQGRINWVVGSGGDATSDITAKMYKRGYSGPLWEYLIRN